MIRIHFFLLWALVHCLSSSVQCNRVNERGCNEAIRCSLVLRARRSILSWRTVALGACAAASGHRGINSAPRLPRAALLSHALHAASAVSRGLGVFQSSTILARVHRRRETSRSGFGGIPRRGYQLQWPLPSSSSPSPDLHPPPAFSPLALTSLQHVEAIGGGGCMC